MWSGLPPRLTYEMHDGKRWIHMFETMCARYKCRPIENIDPDKDADLWLAGPGGLWLTEIASVEFDERGAIVPNSYCALQRLGKRVIFETNIVDRRCYDKNNDEDNDVSTARILDVAIDWFLTATVDRHGERRQCFIRVCRNSRVIYVILLANSVRYATMEPGGLAFSWYNQRLRPFVFILVCELMYRRLDFESLNLHYEMLDSSARWRAHQLDWWKSNIVTPPSPKRPTDDNDDRVRNRADDDAAVVDSRWDESTIPSTTTTDFIDTAPSKSVASTNDVTATASIRAQTTTTTTMTTYPLSASFLTNGSGDGWLELARDTHSRARWLRMPNAASKIVTRRVASGRIQYAWSDANDINTKAYGVNAIAPGTLLNLRDLDAEIAKSRPCVLSLCDFGLLYARCHRYLLYHRNNSRDSTVETMPLCLRQRGTTIATSCPNESEYVYVRETARESRYYIDHEGTLRSRAFVAFS